MSYLKYSCCTRFFVILLTFGLLACGGGGSGGKTSPTSSVAPASLVSSAAASSISSAVSSSMTPDPVLVTTLTLGAPTTNPIVIPPSATAVPVKFLSVVRGNYYPEHLLLDEVDKEGVVLRPGVALLRDDGSNGDAFRGDQIYSGQLLLGNVASVEKSYRVHADHKGQDVKSGTGRFWVSGCPSVARPSNPDKAVLDISSNSYVFADEVLVTLASTVSPELSEINAIMAEAKGQVVGCIPALNQYLVELSGSTTAASLYAAIATLKSKTATVLDASPNALVLSPPNYKDIACNGQACQWYLERIRAPEAWALVGGGDKQMGVGVIDFGVDCKHSDLNCNGGTNSEDAIDHGTGVASLIAAHKSDGSAMVGVAWNTALYPFSFIGRGGSQYKMSELITLSMAEESIRVINISAATAMDPSNQIRDAMCSAIDSGRLIVAAAGNATAANSCQLENAYPARYNSTGTCGNGADLAKGLLVVGAIDANNNLAQWEGNKLCSNTLYVDVFAPGKDIYAATANNNGYAAKNGTSFSSPLVAGSAAVLWAAEPTLTVAQVHDKLVASSVTYTKGTATASRNQTQDPRLEGKQLLDLFAAVGGRDTAAAPDLVPDAFAFTPLSSVDLNSYIRSESIVIKGIDATVPISIEGGFYAIDNAPFTSAAGSVGPNQRLVVQLISASLPLTSRELILTVGGIRQGFKVTTAAAVAAQPSSFDFSDVANAELGVPVLSSPLAIAGLTEALPISIAGGEYAIAGGAFTSANGTVSANQTIQLRVTAASAPDTAVVASVTIAGISDSFRVTTVSADINPEPFVFADINNVAPGSWLTSNSISVKGINTEANISISGGEYAIDGGVYSAASGKVKAGQTVIVRHKSANHFATETYSALTIGNYTTTLRSRTSSNTAPTASNISIQDINGGNLEVGDSLLGIYTYLDAENDPEGASSYRWLRNGVVIAGATTTTYVLVAADSGKDIRFEVTPLATLGIIAGTVKESPVAPIVNSAPRITNLLITANGTGAVGDTLRASYSYQDVENDPEGQSTYRWMRGGVAISGATGASYQTLTSDAGQSLTVEVTPVAVSGKLTGSAVVSNVLLLGNSAPKATSVAISGASGGKSVVGASLAATYVFADVDGDLEGVSLYRWLRNGAAISGATSRTYVLTAADSGQPIVFELTPVAAKGSIQGAAVLSSAIAVNALPTAQAVKVVDTNGGSLAVGDSLSGTYSYFDAENDTQGSSRYRWLRNGSAISGATTSNYVLTRADSGQSIAFEVTPMATAGSVTGTATQSIAVSISNSAPVAANISIVDANGGSLALGDTLNGTYSYIDSDGDGQGATTFRWYRNGAVVSSSQNYTLTAADSSASIQLKVTPRATSGVLLGVEASSAILVLPSFTPNSFSFTPATGVAVGTVVTSNTITLTGLTASTPISIVNGTYSINGGAFTSVTGMVSNAQTLAVRVTAPASFNASTQATLTVGGLSGSFTVTTALSDSTPDAFSFTPVTNAALSSVVISNPVTLSGINTTTTVSVSNGQYAINGGAFTSAAGSVSNGQTLSLKVTASATPGITTQALLTVGGVTGSFSVATIAADTTPEAFSFNAVTNAVFNAPVSSNAITISGINVAVPISISNGQYAIGNGAFTSAAGTIVNGQTVKVQAVAAASGNTQIQSLLTVGTASASFSVTTMAPENTPPAAAVMFPPQRSMTDQASLVVRGVASDSSGIATVSVNGAVAVYDPAQLSWQASVPLNPGENQLVVTVLDTQNNKTTSSVSVRRNPLGDALWKVRIDANQNRFVAIDNSELITIDRITGATALVPGGSLSSPKDLQLSADGTRALVLESPSGLDAIKEITLATGLRKVIAQDTLVEPAGSYNYVYDLALDSVKKRLFVGEDSGIIQLDLTTGVRQKLNSTRSQGLVWDAANNRLIMTSNSNILAFNPDTAVSTTLSSNNMANATSNVNFGNMGLSGLAYDEQKNIAYALSESIESGNFTHAIIEVNLATGSRRLVSDNTMAISASEVQLEDGHGGYSLAFDRANNQLLTYASGGVIGVDATSGVRKWVMKNSGGYTLKFVPSTNTVMLLGGNNKDLYSFVLGAAQSTLISNNTTAVSQSNASFTDTRALTVDPSTNQAYVYDSGSSSIIAVNLQSGSRNTVSDNSRTGQDHTLIDARTMLWLENENRVLVLDSGRRSILSINTATGERTIVTSPTLPSSASALISPVDMLLSPVSGALLILDGAIPAIVSANLTTGARSIYSSLGNNWDNGSLRNIAFNSVDNSLLFNSNYYVRRLTSSLVSEDVLSLRNRQMLVDGATNKIIMVDDEDYNPELVRIDLASKARTLLPVAPTGSGEAIMARPNGIALDPAANVSYVIDSKANAIMRVSLTSGQRTLIASNAIAAATSNINFVNLTAIDIDLENDRLLVGDLNQKALIAVDLATGSRRLISNDTVAVATSNISLNPIHLAINSTGRFAYVMDSTAVSRVDTVTGERRLISNNTIAVASSNISFAFISDIAIDEARGRLLVVDTGVSKVIAVDLATGTRTEFISNETPMADSSALTYIYPYLLSVDKQSGQVVVIDSTYDFVYVADLATGVRRRLNISTSQLMRSYGLSRIKFNASNNTLVVVDNSCNSIFTVDLKTGDAVVLSQ